MKIRVLFLYGGDSVEHEISIISALQAMDGLDTERYEAIPCYVSKQGGHVWRRASAEAGALP